MIGVLSTSAVLRNLISLSLHGPQLDVSNMKFNGEVAPYVVDSCHATFRDTKGLGGGRSDMHQVNLPLFNLASQSQISGHCGDRALDVASDVIC
jgi:hypothetical protein